MLKCSGTTYYNQVITEEQCLACATAGTNDCSYGYALLKSIWEWDSHVRTGIHTTDLTSCLKKSYFDKKSPVAKKLHTNMLLYIGTITHAMLEGAEDDTFTAEMSVEGLGVVGTADVVYENGVLEDFKTTRWMYPQYLPYGKHEQQVNFYAQMLREMGIETTQIFIQYLDMSGPTKCRKCKVQVEMQEDGGLACPLCMTTPPNAHLGALRCEVPVWTAEQASDQMNQRREVLEVALESDIPPLAEPDWLCKYCGHSDICPEAEL